MYFSTAFVTLLACTQAQKKDCDQIPCPYNYEPVCAKPKTGGKAVTLGNDCAVRQYSCETNKGKVH